MQNTNRHNTNLTGNWQGNGSVASWTPFSNTILTFDKKLTIFFLSRSQDISFSLPIFVKADQLFWDWRGFMKEREISFSVWHLAYLCLHLFFGAALSQIVSLLYHLERSCR
jgi:hypothetical protein